MIIEKYSPLWKALVDMQIGNPNASYSFLDRLAAENGWDLDYAARALHEYKKFILLICESGHPCTPSDQVDQVWHLHLLYTRSYWDEMCDGILNRKIHHGPTEGGGEEGEKFLDWYSKTLTSYKEFFGCDPPEDIWPKAEERFVTIHFRRVNTAKTWLIPKWF